MANIKLFEELSTLFKQDPESKEFVEIARQKVKDHLFNVGFESSIDPAKLNSQCNYFSRLRKMLVAFNIHSVNYKDQLIKALCDHGHLAEELKKYDELPLDKKVTRLRVIKRKRKDFTELETVIRDIQILPAGLEHLSLNKEDHDELKQLLQDRIRTRTEEPVLQVDGDIMLQSADLLSPEKDALVVSLLLVTGRRTFEILKTAEFEPVYEKTEDGSPDIILPYVAKFRGQAKTIEEDKEFIIPLLAPFTDVIRAITSVRSMFDTEGMDSEQINKKYAKSVSVWANARFGVNNAHILRAIYCHMCNHVYNVGKTRMTMAGYISKILGHMGPATSIHYQRVFLENFSGPVVVNTIEGLMSKLTNYKETDKTKNILARELMKERLPVTNRNLTKLSGRKLNSYATFLKKNAHILAQYHAMIDFDPASEKGRRRLKPLLADVAKPENPEEKQ